MIFFPKKEAMTRSFHFRTRIDNVVLNGILLPLWGGWGEGGGHDLHDRKTKISFKKKTEILFVYKCNVLYIFRLDIPFTPTKQI